MTKTTKCSISEYARSKMKRSSHMQSMKIVLQFCEIASSSWIITLEITAFLWHL